MEAWIEFGRGPLFRLAFFLMVLGLARVFVLTIVGIREAHRRSPDGMLAWKEIRRQTVGWLVPIRRLWRERPLYSLTSVVFHAGLLLVPLFLASHILLWRRAAGFAWAALPRVPADYLTLLTIATGLGLFLGRALRRDARAISRFQDFAWPPLLVVPFASGYICAHATMAPGVYQAAMLLHIYSANLIMAMIPFTKISHCVLAPLSQVVTSVAWKLVPGAGDRVAATLGFAELPVWVAGARCGTVPVASSNAGKEVSVR